MKQQTGVRYLVTLAWMLTAVSAWAQTADWILFVNGDRVSGTLVRGVGETVVFKTDMAGEITVSLAKIKELHSSGSFAVLKKDSPVARGEVRPGTVTVVGDTVVVASVIGEPQTMPVNQVGYILDQQTFDKEVERKAGFLYGWSGSLTAGATVVESTQYGETFNVGVALARTVPTVAYLRARNRTLLNLTETYGKLTTPVIPQTVPATPDSVVKTSIFHAGLERDQYFSKRFYALANTAFDHNFSQGLELQSLYGAGIGWTPISTPKQQFDVKADVHYERQEFQVFASNQNLFGSTFAQTYRRTLPRKLVFTEGAAVLPAWNNLDAYSANANAALALPLFKRLSVALSASDSFLNNPSAGFKKNSFQFATGLTYSLK